MTNVHSVPFITKKQRELALLEQEAQGCFHFVYNAGMDTDATMFSWQLSNLSRVVGKMRRLRVSSSMGRS